MGCANDAIMLSHAVFGHLETSALCLSDPFYPNRYLPLAPLQLPWCKKVAPPRRAEAGPEATCVQPSAAVFPFAILGKFNLPALTPDTPRASRFSLLPDTDERPDVHCTRPTILNSPDSIYLFPLRYSGSTLMGVIRTNSCSASRSIVVLRTDH